MPFDRETRRVLAVEAGGCCAAPHCGRDIGRPDELNCLGDAAHIYGSKSTAPRYNPDLPESERESEDNGLWLCPSCHRLIDRFVYQYPAEELFRWKRETAARVEARRGRRPTPVGSSDLAEDLKRAQAFLGDQRAAVTALREFRAMRAPFASMGVVLPDATRNQVNWLVGPCMNPVLRSRKYENWCYTPQLASRQVELLRLLQGVSDLPEFGFSQRHALVSFKTEQHPDFQGRLMECYIHPAGSAIVAYLQYYDEVSQYVASERLPTARLRPGQYSW